MLEENEVDTESPPEEEKEGKLVAILNVRVFEDRPAKVEIVERFEGFSFRHIKLAKVGMNRCFRKMRRIESAKETENDARGREEAAKQKELDAKVEEEKWAMKEAAEPSRAEIRRALAERQVRLAKEQASLTQVKE